MWCMPFCLCACVCAWLCVRDCVAWWCGVLCYEWHTLDSNQKNSLRATFDSVVYEQWMSEHYTCCLCEIHITVPLYLHYYSDCVQPSFEISWTNKCIQIYCWPSRNPEPRNINKHYFFAGGQNDDSLFDVRIEPVQYIILLSSASENTELWTALPEWPWTQCAHEFIFLPIKLQIFYVFVINFVFCVVGWNQFRANQPIKSMYLCILCAAYK